MPTVTVVEVVNQVAYMLTDAGHTRWSQAALLAWFNQAQRALVGRRPDTLVVNAAMTCVAGSKQEIPADGIRFMRVQRNASGAAVLPVDKDFMDRHVPNWMGATSAATIQHYVFDERDPKNFYTYPPATTAASLEILYSRSPDVVVIEDINTAVLEVDDVWANAIEEYMLHKAWLKDADGVGNAERAALHLNNFRMAIGDITQADAAMSESQ